MSSDKKTYKIEDCPNFIKKSGNPTIINTDKRSYISALERNKKMIQNEKRLKLNEDRLSLVEEKLDSLQKKLDKIICLLS